MTRSGHHSSDAGIHKPDLLLKIFFGMGFPPLDNSLSTLLTATRLLPPDSFTENPYGYTY
jgi:hypothetical protein